MNYGIMCHRKRGEVLRENGKEKEDEEGET